jgi:ABC-type glycerol-3-phosphate transport system substrate-binding protein
MSRTIALALAAALAAATVAAPADARRAKAVKVVTVKTAQAFKAADTDASRQLSATEFEAAGGNAANFGAIDRNGNGTLGFWETLLSVFAGLKAGRGL